MGFDPASLAIIGLVTSVVGGATGGVGKILEGQSSASAAKYEANLYTQKAAVEGREATIAGMSGSEQAAMSSQKTKATVGALKTNEAAGNISVNSGSAVDVRASAQSLGELDALTIRSNAAREAYGHLLAKSSDTAESQLKRAEASNDLVSGDLSGVSTFLGSAGNAAVNFANFQRAGGMSGG